MGAWKFHLMIPLSASTKGNFLFGWFFPVSINFHANHCKLEKTKVSIATGFNIKSRMSPSLYFDIGRKARDLLYKGYAQQPSTQLQGFDCSLDLSCQVGDILPGLRTLFKFCIPSSAKVDLQYLNGFVGVSGGFGLMVDPLRGYNPLINFSSVIGGDSFALGTDVAFDISTRTFDDFNAGLSCGNDFLIASLNLDDKLDTWRTSFCWVINPSTETAIATEMKHTFSVNDTAITIGGQHALLPSTFVKARINTHASVGALIRQELSEKFAVTIATDVELLDIKKFPKVGLAVAFML